MQEKITALLTYAQEIFIHTQKQLYVKIHISTAHSFLVPTENMTSLSIRFADHVVKFNTRHRRVQELFIVFQSVSKGAVYKHKLV